jgi:hypothetical protein
MERKAIIKLDPDVDLWITYSWFSTIQIKSKSIIHGTISGHTFEMIDYWYILRTQMKVKILICFGMDIDDLKKAINIKYTFNEEEKAELFSSIVVEHSPVLIKGKNILFVDGGSNPSLNNIGLLFDNIFFFTCGTSYLKQFEKDNCYVLEDFRVYDNLRKNHPKIKNRINYKKSILLNKTKKYEKKDVTLFYLTENCRLLDKDILLNYIKDDEKYIIVTDCDYYNDLSDRENITIEQTPYEGFFKCSKYVYTPISKKKDCSPRFITECKYLGIDVDYLNIDYLEDDKGLYWRKWDIENDFKSLELTEDNQIIEIIRNVINEDK